LVGGLPCCPSLTTCLLPTHLQPRSSPPQHGRCLHGAMLRVHARNDVMFVCVLLCVFTLPTGTCLGRGFMRKPSLWLPTPTNAWFWPSSACHWCYLEHEGHDINGPSCCGRHLSCALATTNRDLWPATTANELEESQLRFCLFTHTPHTPTPFCYAAQR
jgi:hypothetical protein